MHEAEQAVQALICNGENLTVEFKSDAKSLSDRDLATPCRPLTPYPCA